MTQGPVAAPVSFTVQDIQTTHRLLSEQWDRQCYRLAQYLERNWCLLNDIPAGMEVEDEKFERPQSVGSIGKVLELVKSETTPRVEKDLYFDPATSSQPQMSEVGSTTLMGGKHPMSFKQFILEEGPESPDAIEEMEARTKQLRVDTSLDRFEEPRTPTQGFFTA